MNEHEIEILRGFAEIARPIIREAYGPNSCIASTRIVIDVLTRFGLEVQPVSVTAQVWNRAYHECLSRRSGRSKANRNSTARLPRTGPASAGWALRSTGRVVGPRGRDRRAPLTPRCRDRLGQ